MTQRENLLRLLRGEAHEFVPVEFSLCPALVEVYRKETGSALSYQDYFDMPWRKLPDLLPDDDDRSRFGKYHPVVDDATEIDEWGVGHRRTPTSMHMTQMLCPLADAADVDDIANYPLPAYSKAGNAGLAEEVRALHARGVASLGNIHSAFLERAWYIRGMENLMMDMACDDPMATLLLDRVADMSLSRALLFADAGVDLLFMGDDIGMQQSTMMSEAMYCKWLAPRLARIISEVKRRRPDILVIYHSCGYVLPFIGHLADAGIDVLNPVQPECMDFAEVYRQFGGRLAFHGGIGTQSTMPLGTPADVRAAVEHVLAIAKDGRLLPAPTHLLEPDVPFENIRAYVEACRAHKL